MMKPEREEKKNGTKNVGNQPMRWRDCNTQLLIPHIDNFEGIPPDGFSTSGRCPVGLSSHGYTLAATGFRLCTRILLEYVRLFGHGTSHFLLLDRGISGWFRPLCGGPSNTFNHTSGGTWHDFVWCVFLVGRCTCPQANVQLWVGCVWSDFSGSLFLCATSVCGNGIL